VRPLRPEDGPALVRFFHCLSPQTRWQRYGRTLDNVSKQWVRREVRRGLRRGPELQVALLALVPGDARRLAAEAQLVRDAPGGEAAELGIVVCDRFQRQGLGAQLLRLLFEAGGAAGITTVCAEMQADNAGMWRSLARLGLPIASEVRGGERFVRVGLKR
jgi:acetyltransferase